MSTTLSEGSLSVECQRTPTIPCESTVSRTRATAKSRNKQNQQTRKLVAEIHRTQSQVAKSSMALSGSAKPDRQATPLVRRRTLHFGSTSLKWEITPGRLHPQNISASRIGSGGRIPTSSPKAMPAGDLSSQESFQVLDLSLDPVQRVSEVPSGNDSSLTIPSNFTFASLEHSIEPFVAQNPDQSTCLNNASRQSQDAIALPLKRARAASIDKTFARQRENVGPPMKKIKINVAEEGIYSHPNEDPLQSRDSRCTLPTVAAIQSSLGAKAPSLIENNTEENVPGPESFSGPAAYPSELLNASTTHVSQMPVVTSVPVTSAASSGSSMNSQSTMNSSVPISPITSLTSVVCGVTDDIMDLNDTMHLKGSTAGNATNDFQVPTTASPAPIDPASSSFPGWGDNTDAMDLEGNTATNAIQIPTPVSSSPIEPLCSRVGKGQ